MVRDETVRGVLAGVGVTVVVFLVLRSYLVAGLALSALLGGGTAGYLSSGGYQVGVAAGASVGAIVTVPIAIAPFVAFSGMAAGEPVTLEVVWFVVRVILFVVLPGPVVSGLGGVAGNHIRRSRVDVV